MQFAAPVAHQTKQRYVYSVLYDRIVRCVLAPGQRLIIDEIAGQLGVSPIPVREALRLLQSEGLIETTPHLGAVVAPISATSVAETFAVLEGLELVSTRLAAAKLTEGDRAVLGDFLAHMDAALAAHDLTAWGDLNTSFHAAIVAITDLPLMIDMTARALSQWDRIRRYFAADVLARRAVQSQHEHHQIVQAMRDGAFAELEALVKHHNQSAAAAYARYMGDHLMTQAGQAEATQ